MSRAIFRRSEMHLGAMALMLALALLVLSSPAGRAQEIRAATHADYGRVVFDWGTPVAFTADVMGGALVVQFDRPVDSALGVVPTALPGHVSDARISRDRRTLSFPLKGDFRLRTFTAGTAAVVDLLGAPIGVDGPVAPASTGGSAPPRSQTEVQAQTRPAPAPAPARSAESGTPLLGVRTGEHDDFFRVVFDWTRDVDYSVDTEDGAAVVRFNRPARINAGALNADMPDGMKGVRAGVENGGLVVRLPLPPDGRVRHFRSGPRVAVDLLGTIPDGAAQAVAAREEATAREAAAPQTATAPATPIPPPPAPRQAPEGGGAPSAAPAPAPAPAAPSARTQAAPAAPAPAPAPAAQVPAGGQAAPADVDSTLRADERAPPPAVIPPVRPTTPPEASQEAPAVEPSDATDPPPPRESVPAPLQAQRAPEQAVPAPEPPSQETRGRAAVPSVFGGSETAPPSPVPGVERLAEARERGEDQPAIPYTQELFTLSFSWDRPTAAAAFRRAGYLWVVFDRYQEADIRALRVTGGEAVRFAEQVDIGRGAMAVRFIVDPAFNPSFRREGLLWIMDLQRQPLRPERPIEVTPQPRSPVGPRLYLPVAEGGNVVEFRDPEVGDQLIVVPVIPLGNGIFPARGYPDVTLPVTAQGVLVEPVSQGVTVRSSRQGVEITAEGGLRLSRDTDRLEALSRMGGETGLSDIFDVSRWRGDDGTPYLSRRQDMLAAVSMAPATRRNDARLELARFYFANGYAAEALGVLRTILLNGGEDYEGRPTFRAIRGGSEFLMGRWQEAVADLGHPSLADVDEAAFWRSAALANMGNPAVQAGIMETTGGVLGGYPDDLKVPLAMTAAEAAIAAANDLSAHNFLEAATADSNTLHQKAHLAFLEGQLQESSGAYEAALDAYMQAEDLNSTKWTPFARRQRLELEYQLDRITAEDLIQGLERLRFSWRGDDWEFSLLRRLAELHLGEGHYGASLRLLKLAATYFEGRPDVREVTEEMGRIFEDLYLKGGADNLSPITAIALYDEFRELTPAGTKGDEMIRLLADRLVAVDLLEQAATLLDRQINQRLTSPNEDRSRVGARLALVRLLNEQPEMALNALDATDGVADLPPEQVQHRTHLKAQALAGVGRPNEAIALLEGDVTEDARMLRAEIFWKAQNWPDAARAISELVPTPVRGQTLEARDAMRVVDWATALTLAGDDPQVALLRRRFEEAMRGTDYFEAFDLITSPTERGVPDFSSVNAKVAQAEEFRSYLAAYRARLKNERLSALN